MTMMKTATSKKRKEPMESKTDQTSASARIRDNQRRSRARRKEYMKELEQRVQKYQIDGIQATREVQEAGRKMAVENGLLRSLLVLHGVSDQSVQEYLRVHISHISLPSSHPEAVLAARSHPDQSPRPNMVDFERPRPGQADYERNDPSPEQMARKPTSLSSSWIPDAYEQPAVSASQSSDEVSELSVPFDSLTPDTSTEHPFTRHEDCIQSGQCTPCETAAGIISSMRGDPDIHDVRSELGCQSNASCMVKNMDIFQLLNE